MPAARPHDAPPLGVVYTPREVARAMVELVLPRQLSASDDRSEPFSTTRNSKDRAIGPALSPDELSAREYRSEPFSPRVCDPAVGEGVFLVEVVEALVRRTGLDRRTICERCIVGVDVDARAIEVARRVLPGADLRVGDALTMPWTETFDLVIGNPPYVRQEHLSATKAGLRGYACYDGVADLYVYFIELAHRIGRRWCFITPNKWMTAAYGAPLRAFLAKQGSVEGVVDMSGVRVFDEDAYASVMWGASGARERPLEAARGDLATPRIPHDRERWTGDAPWHIDDPEERALIDELEARWPAFGEIAPRPMRGLVTGANEVFVLDAVVAARFGDTPFVRPLVRGKDLRPFAATSEKRVLLIGHDVALEALPGAIIDYLRPHRARLEPGQGRKPGAYRWWQLQDPVGPLNASRAPKLLYQDIMTQPACALDEAGLVADTTVWMLPSRDPWLLAVLNSPIFGWYARRRFPPALSGAVRPKRAYIARFPIAPARADGDVLAAYALTASQRRVVARAAGDRGRSAARRSRA